MTTVLPSDDSLIFAIPQWFWAFAVVPVMVLLFVYARQKRRTALDLLISQRLQGRLAGTVSESRRAARFALVLAGLGLGIVTLARPQKGFDWEERKREGRDVLLAMDVSKSMLATDLLPDRLQRSKLAAEDIIAQLQGDRVGVIAFAGSAFLQAPLTVDYSAARETLNDLDTDSIPRGGSNLTEAIKEAANAFGKGESQHKALIIFSDGEELEADAIGEAAKYKSQFRIFTIGVGTEKGALIPLKNEHGGTDFVRGEDRQTVTSHLDEKRLREVAEAAGGFYVRLENGTPAIRQIINDGLAKMSTEDIDTKMKRRPVEQYQWPLCGAVILLLIAALTGERRLAAGRIAALAILFLSLPAHALNNEGMEKLANKDYKGALEIFEKEVQKNSTPELEYNLGCAAYGAEDYDKAAQAFGRAMAKGKPELQAKSAYNLGNALAARGEKQKETKEKLQDWINAEQHFANAAKIAPKNEDMNYNLDEARKMIRQLQVRQKEEEEQSGDGKEKKEDEKKDGKKKDQQQQSGEDKEQKNDKQKKEEQDKQEDEKKEGRGKGGEPKKESEKKDGEGDQKDQQGKKDESGKSSDSQGKPGQEQKDGNGDKKEDGQQAQQQPAKPAEKKEGELKVASQEAGKEGEKTEEAAGVQEASPPEGMSEQDARTLFNSLQKLDRRVQLPDPKRKREWRDGSYKDW